MSAFEDAVKHTLIREGSEEHLREREKNTQKSREFFGQATTKMYREAQAKLADPQYEDPNGILKAREDLAFRNEAANMQLWATEHPKDLEQPNYLEVVQIAIKWVHAQNPELVANICESINETDLSADSFVSHMVGNHIPKPLIADFFETWHGELREIAEKVEKEFDTLKAEMLQKIPEMIAKGELSTETNIDLIQERLVAASVSLIDPLDARQSQHLNRYGASLNAQDHVLIGLFLSGHQHTPALRRHIMYHELVHTAIAGRKLTLEENGGVRTGLHEQKSGLHFVHLTPRPESYTKKKDYYRWINEAKTEKLARVFSDFDEATFYNQEISLLDELVQSGISQSLVTEAYQENYLVGAKGKRLPKTGELFQSVNRVKGPGWLLEQEERFKNNPACET